MKKIFFLILILFSINLFAQTNPDGYIGGLSVSVKGFMNDQRDLQKKSSDVFFCYEAKIKVPLSQWLTISIFYSNIKNRQYYTFFNSYFNSIGNPTFNNPQYGLEINFYIKRIF